MIPAHFGIIIIGGGPIGLACALEAQRAGLSYMVIEKGCLVSSIYNYPSNMSFFSTSERLEIGDVPFVSNNAKPSRVEALEYYRRVATSYCLNINLFEEVLSVKRPDPGPGSYDRDTAPVTIAFSLITNKSNYTAANIVIATGFYDIPYLLNVPGEDLPKVTHYYKEPHFYSFQKLIVVGAQNSAVDAALETWRKGAEVTMVIRQPEIGARVKYWVRPDILNRIKEGSIKAMFNASVVAIREHEVDIMTSDGLTTLANDRVIALTGYQPNLQFLESIGITLSNDEIRKPVYDEETHETNVPDVFLAGVICGGMNTHRLFIENSREHAVKIIHTIKSRTGADN